MKKKLYILFCLLTVILSPCSAEIIETHKFQDLLKFAKKGTLIVTDINNVLIETAHDLGSDQWSNWKIQQLMNENGWTKEEAEDHFIPFYHHIVLASKCKPVESTTVGVIRQLQKKKIPLLGLTAQYTEMAYPTLAQLQSVNIDLSKSRILKKNIDVKGGNPAKYIDGVVFSGLRNTKGQSLKRFLSQINYKPKRVVFIDDKLKHVKSVEAAMQELNIPFTGLRYSNLDKKISEFNPDVAEKQLEHFGKVLSDEEARKLLECPQQCIKGGV